MAILAIWGASYVWSCVLLISAPGVPVALDYKSPGGVIHFRASSYFFDWNSGSGFVIRPRVVGPTGELLASAERVDASGLEYPLRSIGVNVRDVRGKIRRLPSGKFDIQSYFPPRTQPPSEIPFSVSVDRADVQIVDLSGPKVYVQPATATQIEVRGVGDEWLATGEVGLDGVGHLRASLQSLPNEGVLLHGRTAGLRLVSLLNHLRTTPDAKRLPFLADLHADSLIAVGPISVYIPKQAAWELESKVHLSGAGVKFREYSAETAAFDGAISQTGAQGVLKADHGAIRSTFDGAIVWGEQVNLGGHLSASAPNRSAFPAWLNRYVPREIGFRDATWDGSLAYSKEGLVMSGRVVASNATAFGETILAPSIDLDYRPKALRLQLDKGTWNQSPIHGAVLIGLPASGITGAVTADRVRLEEMGRRFGVRGVRGTAMASVLLGGTTAKPIALLRTSGEGTYRNDGRLVRGRFQAAGQWLGNQIDVQRLRVGTNAGVIRAIGTIGVKDKRLALKVDANGIELNQLSKDLQGTLAASGLLRGTFDDPQFAGKAIAVGLEAQNQEIPFASALISADRRRLTAYELLAVKGSGEATGYVSMNWKDRGLAGELKARQVLLNEFFGDKVLGTVDRATLMLSGTLDKPLAAGDAEANNLVVGGIRVDHAKVSSSLNGSAVELHDSNITIGDGSVSITGRYDYGRRAGLFDLAGVNLSLARLTPVAKGKANITGTLDGQASIRISPESAYVAQGNGDLHQVTFNNTFFGNGDWTLGFDGRTVVGGASVGQLERYFQLQNLRYDTETQDINAQITVQNGDLHDLYSSALPFFQELPFETRQKLDTAVGSIDANVIFAGIMPHPNIDLKVLDAKDLEFEGEKLGSLHAVLTKTAGDPKKDEGDIWNAAELWLKGPQGSLTVAEANIDTRGNLKVDADLTNLDLGLIRLIDPSYEHIAGKASISFLASGRTASPEIRASFHSSDENFAILGTTETFGLNLEDIVIRQAVYEPNGDYLGGLSASGKFYYRGIAGDVELHVPVNYPVEIPEGPKITAILSIPHASLAEMSQFSSFLDEKRSEGVLEGKVEISGPKSNLALGGAVEATIKTLALVVPSADPKIPPTPIQTTLTAKVARVELKDQKIVLTFDGQSSERGSLAVNLSTVLPDLGTTIDMIAKGRSGEIGQSKLQGSISTRQFGVRQDSKDKEVGTYQAKLDTNLAIAGTIAEPDIKGRIGITDTNVLLPSVFAGVGPGAESLFNPHFQIDIGLDEIARFRTSTADVQLSGGGLLTGSLTTPKFDGELTLERGRLSLPTTRVVLDEGGTLRPSFRRDSSGNSVTRLDVDIYGRTALTALRYGNTVQRYDINLHITGDLIKEGGLNLDASSDPPDLSKDEILALLGQADVLKSFESGTTKSEAEQRIRSALISIAVPQLTQSLTSQLAKNLGLEYLNIEYNPFEGPSIAMAKVLGKDLILQGRRQLAPQPGNTRMNYELRLTYRLPTRNRALNRFVFSVGMDQDRPWKLGIEYGFRF